MAREKGSRAVSLKELTTENMTDGIFCSTVMEKVVFS